MRKYKLRFLCIMMLSMFCHTVQSQSHFLLEAGATYFTNDVENPATHLPDFLAVTITPRFILFSNNNSAVSLDLPLSIRNKFRNDVVTEFGTHLPALITYNFGAGASGNHYPRRFGALAGVGFGYFYQHTRSRPDETPVYKESLSVRGPAFQLGARFTLSKMTLVSTNERDIHPYIAIKTTYQADTKNRHNDIGSLSVLLGIQF